MSRRPEWPGGVLISGETRESPMAQDGPARHLSGLNRLLGLGGRLLGAAL